MMISHLRKATVVKERLRLRENTRVKKLLPKIPELIIKMIVSIKNPAYFW